MRQIGKTEGSLVTAFGLLRRFWRGDLGGDELQELHHVEQSDFASVLVEDLDLTAEASAENSMSPRHRGLQGLIFRVRHYQTPNQMPMP